MSANPVDRDNAGVRLSALSGQSVREGFWRLTLPTVEDLRRGRPKESGRGP